MPTKSPETTMMMSESTPLKYTSRMTSRKRSKLVPDEAITRKKKRAMTPMRQMPSITLWPSRARGWRTRLSIAPLRETHVRGIRPRGIVEGNRAVGLAMDELAHERVGRGTDLLGRSLAHD